MKYHIGETPKRPTRTAEPTMGYQWPASKLTAEDMHRLHSLRLQTRKQITLLLHEAVEALYNTVTQPEVEWLAPNLAPNL